MKKIEKNRYFMRLTGNKQKLWDLVDLLKVNDFLNAIFFRCCKSHCNLRKKNLFLNLKLKSITIETDGKCYAILDIIILAESPSLFSAFHVFPLFIFATLFLSLKLEKNEFFNGL